MVVGIVADLVEVGISVRKVTPPVLDSECVLVVVMFSDGVITVTNFVIVVTVVIFVVVIGNIVFVGAAVVT
jgi:hypothetical protein